LAFNSALTGARLSLMLKGGGSDNASLLTMLAPGDGWPAIRRQVLDLVEAKAANACPPLVIGIGIGSTFDKVAGLSKQALLRPLTETNPRLELAEREAELLQAINELAIGPAALGGRTTALAVHILTAPCHLAALPLAVNLGCCAQRSITFQLDGEWAR